MAAVTICSDFGAQKNKVYTVSNVSQSISHEVKGPDAIIFVFWMLSFKSTFSLFSFTFIKRLFSSSFTFTTLSIRVVSSAYLRLLIFLQAILIPAQCFSWCTLHFFHPFPQMLLFICFQESESCSVVSNSHGILQARTLEWAALPFSRGSSQPRDWTQVSHIAGRFFTSWATREAQTTFMIIISSYSFSAIRVVSSAYLRLLIFLLAILIPACASSSWHFTRCTLHIS